MLERDRFVVDLLYPSRSGCNFNSWSLVVLVVNKSMCCVFRHIFCSEGMFFIPVALALLLIHPHHMILYSATARECKKDRRSGNFTTRNISALVRPATANRERWNFQELASSCKIIGAGWCTAHPTWELHSSLREDQKSGSVSHPTKYQNRWSMFDRFEIDISLKTTI